MLLYRRRHSSGGSAGCAKTSDAVDLYRTLPPMFEQRDLAGVKRVLERGGGTPDIPELLVISIVEFIFLLEDEDFAEDATAAQVCLVVLYKITTRSMVRVGQS